MVINYKETGRKFTEAMKKIAQDAKVKTTAALATTLMLTSCDWQPMTGSTFDTAKWDFVDGTTQKLIAEAVAERNTLVEAYDHYMFAYEKGQKILAQHIASGNVKAAGRETERLDDLKSTIKKTEKKIESLEDELIDLGKYKMRGKKNAKIQEASHSDPKAWLKRRTFKKID